MLPQQHAPGPDDDGVLGTALRKSILRSPGELGPGALLTSPMGGGSRRPPGWRRSPPRCWGHRKARSLRGSGTQVESVSASSRTRVFSAKWSFLVVPSCWENRRHACPAQPVSHRGFWPPFHPGPSRPPLTREHALLKALGPMGRCPGPRGCRGFQEPAGSHHGAQFSLMVTFPEVPLGIFLFCMCVIAIGVVQALIVLYAFHFPHLLSPQIERSAHRGLYRQHILGIIMRGPALCLAAAGFSLFFYPASYLLMATVIFLPYVSKAAGWCRAHLTGPREPPAHSMEVFTFDLHEPLSKERVEAFSDGVYAIVATLLILDICEDNVPDAKDVKEKFQGSLVTALGESGPHFLAYFGSFATVGLLWFAHHSLFLHIRRATQPMGLLNTLSLAFVGGLPLAYQQTSAFAQQPRDELESVRVSCAIIFLASIFQFAIWTTALLREGETLQPSARFGGREHAFMFAKLALYPCASLLAFACTCVLSSFSTAIFHAMQIAVPFTFLLLRLLVRLALASLRALRGLVGPVLAQPAPGAADEAQSPLLPAPC
ncbi:endosomal/lysosomal proton channel TMEM175 isoform X2 [Odocoileus virginianus]|uniref:Endosomal/lysosomal proton channel TMEM175 n=1 Tax=Odocoileus virginianus TaxID=9874 RepID=A0ABM4HSQ0_ODOVR